MQRYDKPIMYTHIQKTISYPGASCDFLKPVTFTLGRISAPASKHRDLDRNFWQLTEDDWSHKWTNGTQMCPCFLFVK